MRVTTAFEEVYFSQQLLFLLFKLRDLFFELSRVHALLSEGLSIRVHSLELSLKVLVDLEGVSHVIVVHEFIRDLQRHEELSRVRLPLQVLQTA